MALAFNIRDNLNVQFMKLWKFAVKETYPSNKQDIWFWFWVLNFHLTGGEGKSPS